MWSSANSPPRPVAASRPSEPPTAIGLPVSTARLSIPLMRLYSSAIQAISRPEVFTSGAGTSISGPMMGAMPRMKDRHRRSSSRSESSLGFTRTPPLPPPYGRSSSEVFHVMSAAKQRNSSSEASSWKRRPPL